MLCSEQGLRAGEIADYHTHARFLYQFGEVALSFNARLWSGGQPRCTEAGRSSGPTECRDQAPYGYGANANTPQTHACLTFSQKSMQQERIS
jgi:hypothetical protein